MTTVQEGETCSLSGCTSGVTANSGISSSTPLTHASTSPSSNIDFSSRPVSDTIYAWVWELASIGISLVIVLAIFITLVNSSGKEVPHWPLSLNLSSLISIYSTVLRGLLFFTLAEIISQEKWSWLNRSHQLGHLDTFDSASRGAWGSLMLLPVAYRAFIPSAAAVTMVLLMAVGPFSQQSVQTATCSRESRWIGDTNDRASAIVPIANSISTEHITEGDALLQIQAQPFQVLLSGLTNPEYAAQASRLEFTCATGNCTFPVFEDITYSSLGICSACEELSHLIKESDIATSIPNATSSGSPWLEHTYSLNDLAGDSVQVQPVRGNLIHVSTSISEPYYTFSTTVLVRSSVRSSERSLFTSHRQDLPHLDYEIDLTGARCKLFGCIKHYRGEIVNGQLIETVPKTSSLNPPSDSSSTFIGIASPCSFFDSRTGEMVQMSSPAEATTEMSNHIYVPTLNGTIIVPPGCVFELDATWMYMLGDAIKQLLSGTCGAKESRDNGSSKPTYTMFCQESWWLQSLWENDNSSFATISKRFDGIATSLTNQMREIGLEPRAINRGKGKAWGKARSLTVCTRFDWQWMLLPAGVTVLTFVLLMVSILRTHGDIKTRVTPPWKSSTLPFLFYGFKNHTDETTSTSLMSLERMKRRSAMLTARYTADMEDGREGYGITVTSIKNEDSKA
ncbi:hypothetical protein QBC43DRAFT_301368 [Cladorrhinum sp. PSN259]|nr:hypothetical protein QBC43DRAFT_301368 [Cladorrhinum sp. PSN259]